MLAIGLSLHGCGNRSNKTESSTEATPKEGQISGRTYLVLQNPPVEQNDNLLRGNSSIVFNDPLGEINSAKNIDLTFNLEEGQTLQLITHCDNKLTNGVHIVLSRAKNLLKIETVVDGKHSPTARLKMVSDSEPIRLFIDVHNDEDQTHVLVWDKVEKFPSEDNALFNSGVDGETQGKGKGRFWGMILGDATVRSVFVDDALFEH